MPGMFNFNEFEILAFFLVLVRMSAFVVTWPVFGVEMVPGPLKILLAVVMSILIFPNLKLQPENFNVSLDSLYIVVHIVKEAFLGMALGFLGRIFFYTLNVAGEIITVSMGISSAQLFNPAVGGQTTATTQFLIGLATLFFLAIQGHHLFLMALHQSFELVPVYKSGISLVSFGNFAQIVQDVSVMGLKMSSPVLVAILLMNIVMALVGRAVPQINVLITSLPVNILIGFLVMLVALPLFLNQMNSFLELSASRMFQMLKEF